MREIAPGLWHWTAVHEKIRVPVHSYYLAHSRVLIDPMTPPGGVDALGELGTPKHVLLTNRHHYRHSGKIAEAFGTVVRCHRAGLHEFTKGEPVEPFEFGDELPGGIRALEVGALCPEETALLIEIVGGGGSGASAGKSTGGGTASAAGSGGALALGDSVIRGPEGDLEFVPDDYMGDDPGSVKRGLRASLRKLLDQRFDILLLAHGEPFIADAKAALREFLEA